MSAPALASESGRQTTRVVPRCLGATADANVRAVGALPPAGGLTDGSGRGSGPYGGRSPWAGAGAGSWRPMIDEVGRATGADPDTLEAIVLLESAGRPEARASDSLEGAVGLTQILAETGRNLLGMRVDVAASRRLTRRIARAEL